MSPLSPADGRLIGLDQAVLPAAYPPDAAPAPAAADLPPASFPIPMACVSFTPAHHPGPLLGFCDLRLPGGLELRELRVCRRPAGLEVNFPRRGVIEKGQLARFPDGTPRLLRPAMVPDPTDAAAFTRAALAAVVAAFPDALPDYHPAPTTPRSAILAPATAKEHAYAQH